MLPGPRDRGERHDAIALELGRLIGRIAVGVVCALVLYAVDPRLPLWADVAGVLVMATAGELLVRALGQARAARSDLPTKRLL